MAVKLRIRNLAVLFILLFLLPIAGLTRFQILEADSLNSNPHNFRLAENLSLRGQILDRKGAVLAKSKDESRIYPLGEITAPLIGYLTPRFGAAGLEASFEKYTVGFPIPRDFRQAIIQIAKGSRMGDDISLTLDADLQTYAYDTLAGYRGSAVVIDVKTGEILALVSRPSFDPNGDALEKNWNSIINNSSSPLIERSTQGLYPPGSTFKVLIMAGALDDKLTQINEKFNCTGSMDVGNFILNCNSKHGVVDLKQALMYSCNMAFAELGLRMGTSGIRRWMGNFNLDKDMPLVPGSAKPFLPKDGSKSAPAESAIGQADVLVSPLHMCRTAAVIARQGLDLEPRLLKARMRNGKVLWQPSSFSTKRVVSAQSAALVADAMAACVKEGTGGLAQVPGLDAAGKTGSAENPQGAPHAWFIGYAPLDKPEIAVAVLLENAGGGGRYAAPVAGRLFKRALNK